MESSLSEESTDLHLYFKTALYGSYSNQVVEGNFILGVKDTQIIFAKVCLYLYGHDLLIYLQRRM